MALLELPSELLALIHRDLELLTSLPPRRVDRIICTNLKLKGSFGNFVALARSILSRLLLRRRTPTTLHYLKLAGRVQDEGTNFWREVRLQSLGVLLVNSGQSASKLAQYRD
jgi:hypothetical protein